MKLTRDATLMPLPANAIFLFPFYSTAGMKSDGSQKYSSNIASIASDGYFQFQFGFELGWLNIVSGANGKGLFKTDYYPIQNVSAASEIYFLFRCHNSEKKCQLQRVQSNLMNIDVSWTPFGGTQNILVASKIINAFSWLANRVCSRCTTSRTHLRYLSALFSGRTNLENPASPSTVGLVSPPSDAPNIEEGVFSNPVSSANVNLFSAVSGTDSTTIGSNLATPGTQVSTVAKILFETSAQLFWINTCASQGIFYTGWNHQATCSASNGGVSSTVDVVAVRLLVNPYAQLEFSSQNLAPIIINARVISSLFAPDIDWATTKGVIGFRIGYLFNPNYSYAFTTRGRSAISDPVGYKYMIGLKPD